jgi:hypothetical protein
VDGRARPAHATNVLVAILGTLAVVGVFVAIGIWLDRRISVLPRVEELREAGRRKPMGQDHEAGLAPATALRSDPERMRRVVERQRCCKEPMAVAGEDDIRYDDRQLRVIRLRCATCEASRALYYELRAPAT